MATVENIIEKAAKEIYEKVMEMIVEETGVSPQRLCELAKADSDGKCFIPPISVGDSVYWVIEDVNGEFSVSEDTVTEVGTKGFFVSDSTTEPENISDFYEYSEIGETAFLSEDDAKRKIVEITGVNA